MKHRNRVAPSILVAVFLAIPASALAQSKKAPAAPAKAPAGSDAIRAVLDSGDLALAYNPVLLNYLLGEGRPKLPPAQHKKALDQIVSRFKQEINVTPAEQAVASSSAAAGMLMGGTLGQGFAQGSYDGWAGWVDAAFVLGRAGYKTDVVPFFENCIVTFPYDSLREKCTLGLTAVDSERAYQILVKLEERPGDERKIALRLLGFLAGQKGTSKTRHDAIVDLLISRTEGIKNTVFSAAAIDGLLLAGDRRAIEPLRKMTKGLGRAEDVERAAKRALLIGFKDASIVEMLEKDAKGGLTKNDDDKLFAGALLIEGGYDEGYAWATEQLTKKKGGLSRFSKSKGDISGDIVWVLSHRGGKKAIPVLKAALPLRKPDEWLSAAIAIGLLDRGDPSGKDVARLALTNPKWLATRLEAAEGLAAHGDFSGIAVLRQLTEDKSLFKKAGDMAMGRYRSADQVKIAVAGSLADMDRAEGVDLLKDLLNDPSADVRMAAAYAFARMKTARALEGLSAGLSIDYGKHAGRSRSPEVRAHLLRMALLRFAANKETRAMVSRAAESEDLSVRFLALIAQRG